MIPYANVLMPIVDPMGSGKTLKDAYEDFRVDNEAFFNFSGMHIHNGSMLNRMNVARCGATADNPERIHYATAPKSNEIAASIGRDLELFCNFHFLITLRFHHAKYE